MTTDTDALRTALEAVQQAAADLQRDVDRLAEIKATIRVNALRGGATADEADSMVRGEKSFVDFLAKLCDVRAALAAASQPARINRSHLSATISNTGNLLGWRGDTIADDLMSRFDITLRNSAAPQPAPDREALVEAILDSSYLPPDDAGTLADALLARGLRLQGGEETMEPDHDPMPVGDIGNYYGGLFLKRENGVDYWSIENYDGFHWEACDPAVARAIRVVEGGDDAA